MYFYVLNAYTSVTCLLPTLLPPVYCIYLIADRTSFFLFDSFIMIIVWPSYALSTTNVMVIATVIKLVVLKRFPIVKRYFCCCVCMCVYWPNRVS